MPPPISERRLPVPIEEGQATEVDGREALLGRLRRVARGEESSSSISPIELFGHQMISEANLVRQTVLLTHFLRDSGIGIRKNYYASLYEKLAEIIPTGITRLVDRKNESSKAIVLYRVYPLVANTARAQVERAVDEIKRPQSEPVKWEPQTILQESETGENSGGVSAKYNGLSEIQQMVMRLYEMKIYERVIGEVLGKTEQAVRELVSSSFDRIDPKRERKKRLHPPFNQWLAVVDYAKLRSFLLDTEGRLPTTTDINRAVEVGVLHFSPWVYTAHFGQGNWQRAQDWLEEAASAEAIKFLLHNIQNGIHIAPFQEHFELIQRAETAGILDTELSDVERHILRFHYRTDWARRSWDELRSEFGYKSRQRVQERAKTAIRKLKLKL